MPAIFRPGAFLTCRAERGDLEPHEQNGRALLIRACPPGEHCPWLNSTSTRHGICIFNIQLCPLRCGEVRIG